MFQAYRNVDGGPCAAAPTIRRKRSPLEAAPAAEEVGKWRNEIGEVDVTPARPIFVADLEITSEGIQIFKMHNCALEQHCILMQSKMLALLYLDIPSSLRSSGRVISGNNPTNYQRRISPQV